MTLLSLFGGLALLLYGMQLIGEGLQRSAGGHLRHLLTRMTRTRLAADLGLKLVDLAQLTRIALTGKTASPPIFEVVSILGRTESLARLKAAAAAVGSAG